MSKQQGRSATDEDILKTLMTGLLYPAVLGTVIYIGLDSIVETLRSVREALRHGSAPVDFWLTLKLLSLFATVAFYSFAFMYTLFTRTYRRLFFLYDCIFVVTLYVTIFAIGLQRRTLPDLPTMTLCYMVFVGLYLLWDRSERMTPTNTPDETILYDAIIRWEKVSLVAFLATYAVVILFAKYLVAPIVFVAVLAATTARFGYLTWRKRLYW